MKLNKYKLSELAKVEISGVDKKTIDNETKVRLCNFVDVYHNWAITKELIPTFMEASAKAQEIKRFSILKGQVALTKDSETRDDIGIPTYIADTLDNIILGYHNALITPTKGILNGKYLNTFLRTKFIQKYFELNASGSGQRYSLSVQVLNDIPIFLPPLKKQEIIGNIFSSIDRKIALNRAINHNLEAMAKQLYDYWFVQFDFPDENGKPYKSSGGKMIWNEKFKREIPEGWTDATLETFLTIKNGKDHKHLPDGIYPVYGSGGQMRLANSSLYEGESVLMPRKGSLNNIMYVNEAFWTVDTMFYSEMKLDSCAKYVYYSIKNINFAALDSGTGVPSMTSSTLYATMLIRPINDILKKFDKIITLLYSQVKSLSIETNVV